ncbi:MAG: hypothetical protein WAQ52_02230 [Terriglobales bacterium]
MLLWISPHLLLAIVAILIYKRRLYREFPFFLLYTLYEIGAFVLLYGLNSVPSVTAQQYTYAFMVTLAISIALRFGVIKEVSEDLFREHPVLKVTARQSLRWSKALLVVIGIACAAYAPGEDGVRLIGGLAVISRGVAIIQSGLLVFLLGFARFFGLSWRGCAFGIALGLGVLSSVDLATSAIRAQVASEEWARALNLLTTGSYLICALIWLGYLLAPERKPSILSNVSRDEVDDWSQELQRWLRP